ncbi:MAG: DEAD/DEAH box helicase family protein [Reyranella sp.]
MANRRSTPILQTDSAALQAENARLIALLDAHGIEWRQPQATAPGLLTASAGGPRLSPDDKVALFRRLFRGRMDVYPVRWESRTSGRSGYAPACANEWKPGICEKPRIKCSDCSHRALLPLSDAVIYDHLAGEHTIGVYPLLPDDTCHFLAVDFDEEDWSADVQAFRKTCAAHGVPLAVEISRSGRGAHAWIFFAGPVPARDARRLGTALISATCDRTRQLRLTSYDRLFPNQDTMPKGGFGNLIALPLQKRPREHGHSVFVDDTMTPYPDPWAYLSTLSPMAGSAIEPVLLRLTGGRHPLDVTFIEEEDCAEPWRRSTRPASKLPGPMPESLRVTLGNLVYFDKTELPQPLANRLIRIAAFQNPGFYRAQAMRRSVWNQPRVIGCAENFPRHLALPRGCLDAALELLEQNDVGVELLDERFGGEPITARFAGTLRRDQQLAVTAMLKHDIGVLCAPTAFGKTVTAAALIARRAVNTLILVHRTDLLTQWRTRLATFLDVEPGAIGVIGGGRSKPSGRIDVAVLQSLSRNGEVDPQVQHYGQVIVDECHHVSAVSIERILREVRAKFVVGLTATPIRRDGLQPIIVMQCGPIRHAVTSAPAALDRVVEPRWIEKRFDVTPDTSIQEVFRQLVRDPARNATIAAEVREAVAAGRKVLVLTERTDHLEAIHVTLADLEPAPIILHGRLSKSQRDARIRELDTLAADAPRVILATGRLVGEGFDHPALDTLILAMPVSWKGTLQQYAGRLHRAQAGKTAVRIIDIVDAGHPVLLRMWEKRRRGYHAMGYRVAEPLASSSTAANLPLHLP